MKKLLFLLGFAAAALPTAAAAHDTDATYPTRGACEAASAGMSNFDRTWLPVAFPDIFATNGEVASFLTKAWTCDLNADGQYSIVDHRQQVLDSDWWAQRKR